MGYADVTRNIVLCFCPFLQSTKSDKYSSQVYSSPASSALQISHSALSRRRMKVKDKT